MQMGSGGKKARRVVRLRMEETDEGGEGKSREWGETEEKRGRGCVGESGTNTDLV